MSCVRSCGCAYPAVVQSTEHQEMDNATCDYYQRTCHELEKWKCCTEQKFYCFSKYRTTLPPVDVPTSSTSCPLFASSHRRTLADTFPSFFLSSTITSPSQ